MYVHNICIYIVCVYSISWSSWSPKQRPRRGECCIKEHGSTATRTRPANSAPSIDPDSCWCQDTGEAQQAAQELVGQFETSYHNLQQGIERPMPVCD